jgi:hypothetical protein
MSTTSFRSALLPLCRYRFPGSVRVPFLYFTPTIDGSTQLRSKYDSRRKTLSTVNLEGSWADEAAKTGFTLENLPNVTYNESAALGDRGQKVDDKNQYHLHSRED